jgi:signal transduction histidine kinase
MKFRYRIILLYTTVVTAILFLVCYSVFYFSSLNRLADFKKLLKVRAITTLRLLINNDDGINKEQLKRLDETTFLALQQKTILVFNANDVAEYDFTDNNTEKVTVTKEQVDKARLNGEYSFSEKNKDVFLIAENNIVSVAAAHDVNGFERLKTLSFILLISFFTGTAITFLSGLLFSLRLVKPIKKISGEVHEISSQNLSRRIAVGKAKDELYELSSTFNDLLTRLQESFEIQRRFIANASHELSTPLTSISSQLEITLQKERPVEEYKTVLYSVYEDVRNLTELTRSLLEIAKASGTKEGIELSLVRIDELLLRIPADLKKIDPQYAVELHFDIFPEEEDCLLIFGNSDLLYSALKNVVTNACKYSEDHLAVVSLNFTTPSVNIKVSDNGPGINENEMDLVFQPFYRSDAAKSKQGFGLGLPLALRIIKLHKGEITIQSNKNGCIFNIILPTARLFHQS